MRLARLLAVTSVLVGGGLLATAGVRGELTIHILVVLPLLTGSSPLAVLGMLALFAGVVGVLLTTPTTVELERGSSGAGGHSELERGARSKRHGGGVILIGPIPIAWGSDRRWLVAALVLALLLVIAGLTWTVLSS